MHLKVLHPQVKNIPFFPRGAAHGLEMGPVVPPASDTGDFTLDYEHPKYDPGTDKLSWAKDPISVRDDPDKAKNMVKDAVDDALERDDPQGIINAGRVAVAGFMLKRADKSSRKLSFRESAALGEEPEPPLVRTRRGDDQFDRMKHKTHGIVRRLRHIEDAKSFTTFSSPLSRRGEQDAIIKTKALHETRMAQELKNLRAGVTGKKDAAGNDITLYKEVLGYDQTLGRMTSTRVPILPTDPEIQAKIKKLEMMLGEQPMPATAHGPGETKVTGSDRLHFNSPQSALDEINSRSRYSEREYEAKELERWLRLHKTFHKTGGKLHRMANGDDLAGKHLHGKIMRRRHLAHRVLSKAEADEATAAIPTSEIYKVKARVRREKLLEKREAKKLKNTARNADSHLDDLSKARKDAAAQASQATKKVRGHAKLATRKHDALASRPEPKGRISRKRHSIIHRSHHRARLKERTERARVTAAREHISDLAIPFSDATDARYTAHDNKKQHEDKTQERRDAYKTYRQSRKNGGIDEIKTIEDSIPEDQRNDFNDLVNLRYDESLTDFRANHNGRDPYPHEEARERRAAAAEIKHTHF